MSPMKSDLLIKQVQSAVEKAREYVTCPELQCSNGSTCTRQIDGNKIFLMVVNSCPHAFCNYCIDYNRLPINCPRCKVPIQFSLHHDTLTWENEMSAKFVAFIKAGDKYVTVLRKYRYDENVSRVLLKQSQQMLNDYNKQIEAYIVQRSLRQPLVQMSLETNKALISPMALSEHSPTVSELNDQPIPIGKFNENMNNERYISNENMNESTSSKIKGSSPAKDLTNLQICNRQHIDDKTNVKRFDRDSYQQRIDQLIEAVRIDDVDNVQRIVELGIDPQAQTSERNSTTVVALSASLGRIRCLQLMLQYAYVDVRDESYRTPLHLSIAKEQIDAMRLLVDEGADPDAQDSKGVTPRLMAQSKPPFFDILNSIDTSISKERNNSSKQRRLARALEFNRRFVVCIAMSADLQKKYFKQLSAICQQIHWLYYEKDHNEPTDQTTHFIVDDRMTKRRNSVFSDNISTARHRTRSLALPYESTVDGCKMSIAMYKAMQRGCWVLCEDWLKLLLECHQTPDELSYEVSKTVSEDFVEMGLAQNARQLCWIYNTYKPFVNTHFFLVRSHASQYPKPITIKSLRTLIYAAGGKIFDSERRLRDRLKKETEPKLHVIYVPGNIEDLKRFMSRKDILLASVTWVLECLRNGRYMTTS